MSGLQLPTAATRDICRRHFIPQRFVLLLLVFFLPTTSTQDICAPGTYRPTPATASCQPCPTTAYCVFGAAYACPANSSTAGSATAIDACACDDGFRLRTDYGIRQCAPCPAGSYCRNGSVTACPPLETSPVGSTTPSSCTCQPGAQRPTAGGACAVCPADTYCAGGASAAAACPAHAHSRAGSFSASDCECLAPFAGLYAHGAWACFHLSTLDSVAHGLPQVSTVRLASHVTLALDGLNAFQRGAVWLGSGLVCHGADGRAAPCPHVLRGGMLNASHALVILDNAAVAPEFLSVLNYALRAVTLASSTYLVERTVWFASDRVLGARAQALHLDATARILSSAHRHDAVAQQLVAAVRAAVHNGSVATVEQVELEDTGLRIGYHWLHARGGAARMAALACLGAASTAGHALDAAGFAPLGALRCPGAAAFACVEAALGNATDYDDKGVECALAVRVLHNSDADLAAAVAAAAARIHPALAVGPVAAHALRVFHAFELRATHADFVLAVAAVDAAAAAVRRDALSVVLDTGSQTTAVLTAAVGAAPPAWGELLLAANFSALQAWELGADASALGARYERLLLAFLAHTASPAHEAGAGPVRVRLANGTLAVDNYVLGRAELLAAAQTLCAFTACADCAALTAASSHARLEGHVTLRAASRAAALAYFPDLAPSARACNATQETTRVVGANDAAVACNRAAFVARATVEVPLPPELVLGFVADALVGAAAGDVDVADYHVAPSAAVPGGSTVTLYVRAASQASCAAADFVDLALLSAALASIWPYAGGTAVAHDCLATCRNESAGVDLAAAAPAGANETLACRVALGNDFALADTQDAAWAALQAELAAPAGVDEVIATYTLTSSVDLATTCDGAALQAAFDDLHASEFALDRPASGRWFHEFSVWNAAQKPPCVAGVAAGRGCAHAVNVSAAAGSGGDGCLLVSALNVHLARAEVEAALVAQAGTLAAPVPVSRLVSDPVWMSGAAYAAMQPVLAAFLQDGRVDVAVSDGVLLQQVATVPRAWPFSDARERLLLANASGVLLRNRVTFDIFTVSSLASVNSTNERVNFVAAALELLLSPSTSDFSIQALSHTPLALSPRLETLTADERLLVDNVDAELMLTATVLTSQTCAGVRALLEAWQPFPVPFTDDIYFHVLHGGTQCETELALSYPARSCAERRQYAADVCTEGAPWKQVVVNASDDALFFQVLDVVAAGAPVEAVAFEHVVEACGVEAVAAKHGEFLCVCVRR